MIEILALIALVNINKKNALARGRKPGGFIALTICLWLGLEFLGAFIGGALNLGFGIYVLAIIMAGIGALISYLAAKNCKPGTYMPPAQPVIQNTAPNVEPAAFSGPAQMQYMTTPYSEYEQGTLTSYCHKCGAPLIEGALFCSDCGQQRYMPVQPVNTRTSIEKNDAVQFQYNSNDSVPCTVEPMRAVWTAVWLIGIWLMIYITHILPDNNLIYCGSVSYTIVTVLLGTGMYLLMQQGVKYKVYAGGIMFMAVLIYLFNYFLLDVLILGRLGVNLHDLFLSSISLMRIINILLRVFVAAGGALLFTRLLRPKRQCEPVLDNDTTVTWDSGVKDEKKRVWRTSLYTALVSMLIQIVFTISTSRIYSERPILLVTFFVSCLITATTLFFTPPALHALSAMKTKHIQLSGWGLVWCWLCVAGMFFSIAMYIAVMVNLVPFPIQMYSSQFLMSIVAFTGFIMLIAKKRLGWYIVLFGSYVALVGQFNESFNAVVQGATDYTPLLTGAIFGSLNPLITWLSIRGAWRANPVNIRQPLLVQ
ncbi:MAG TPA: zinc ribbon domain-containing protein [Clostridiaceae bacterium]|nr:zinc ribbon domain-containing protein [Clostridiaceae bacterium]